MEGGSPIRETHQPEAPDADSEAPVIDFVDLVTGTGIPAAGSRAASTSGRGGLRRNWMRVAMWLG